MSVSKKRLLLTLVAFFAPFAVLAYVGLVISLTDDVNWTDILQAALLIAPLTALGAVTFPLSEPSRSASHSTTAPADGDLSRAARHVQSGAEQGGSDD